MTAQVRSGGSNHTPLKEEVYTRPEYSTLPQLGYPGDPGHRVQMS